MPPTLQSARVVWGALLGAITAYLTVLVFVLREPASAPPADVASMRAIFVVIAGATVGLIFFFRRQPPSAGHDIARSAPVDAQTSFTTYVIGWALAESIALYGLVLGMLSRSFDEALPFFATGAALLVWQRPRPEHFGA